MTVINMLSLGDSGIAVADEQSSTYTRKYNLSQKLNFLDKAVYGGSGAGDLIKAVYELSRKRIEEEKSQRSNVSLQQIFDIVKFIAIDYKNQTKNNFLRANVGIGLDDFLTGTFMGKQLDVGAKGYASNLLQSLDEKTSLDIFLGGMEDKQFMMYFVNTSGIGIRISRPYASIGSGSEESERVLSNYVSHLSREKRKNIDKIEGLIKIIEATNSSSRLNVGVGGIFSIVHIQDDKTTIPNENQCILASEIVEGLTQGLLEKDFSYQAIARLVFEDSTFESIEEEVKHNAKDWKKLDRILRGYKE